MKFEQRLKGKSSQQRANIKAEAIAALPLVGEHSLDGLRIQIQEVKKIEGGVAVFARAWKNGKQLGFGKDGSVDIERFRIFNPPILVDDQFGDIEILSKDERSGIITSRKLREDPEKALKEVLSHIVKLVGRTDTQIIKGKVGNTTSSFYPAVDGRTEFYNPPSIYTWASIITQAGNGFSDSSSDQHVIGIYSTATTDRYEANYKGWLKFNTSGLPDTDVIASATLSVYPTEVNNGLGGSVSFVEGTVASTTNLAATDHLNHLTTKLATDWAFSGISTGAYKDAALNASGIAAISKTAYTTFALVHSNVLSGSPTWANTATSNMKIRLSEFSGTTSDPILVVVHEAAAIEASVSPLELEITIPTVTANEVHEASVSPLVLEIDVPAVTAIGINTASVSPLELELTIPEVSATGAIGAVVSPLELEITIPAVSTTSHVNAEVEPLVLNLSIPSVTAAGIITASVSPLSLLITLPEVTASFELPPIPEATSAGGFPFALDLCDGSDVDETLHTPIINVKGWSKRINAPGKMVFRMNKHHAEATDANLRLWRNIRLYRRKRDGTADMEAVWYGLILAKREVGDYIEVLCHGALRIFSKRETGAAEAFTGQGSTEAFGLLTAANLVGPTGVSEGTGEITETLDLELDHVEMLRAFEQIHSATGGEFEVDDLGALNSVASLGSDKSATIELIFRQDGQEGNLLSYEIAEDGEQMANRIIGTTNAGGGLTSTYNHPTSTDDYPVLVERKAFNEAQDQGTLDALTEAYGLQRGLPIPDFHAIPATAVKKFNTLTGEREISGLQYGDVEVGDLVLVTVITPNRNESLVKRVAELIVDVDENLNEEFRFTLTEAGVFVTERYLDDTEMHDIKRRIQEIELAL